jgi:hypothetical protein
VTPEAIPAWFQAGGLLAFAAAVWMEQRSMRVTLEAMRGMMAAVLEYARRNDDDEKGR